MAQTVSERLAEMNAEFVRVVWCDNASIIRAKAFHVAILAEHEKRGVGMSVARQGVSATQDHLVSNSGLSPVGEIWMVPDWDTLTCVPFAENHAQVMVDMFESGSASPLCPRGFLRRMIESAESSAGITIKAAFENEFTVLSADGAPAPAYESLYGSARSMNHNAALLRGITEALAAQAIQVERFHAESAPGQFEVITRYGDALSAADHQVMFRETVAAVVDAAGQKCTFLPALREDGPGNGCHLHFSLWSDGRNITGNEDSSELSEQAESFVAGVLEHLPALMALTTPSPNSYRRIRPGAWSGAFQVWGYNNREAALRVPTEPIGPTTNVELKTVDATSNPYLALGAVIACGLDGVERALRLPPPTQVPPASLDAIQQRASGIKRLPNKLDISLRALAEDSVILNALGEPLARALIAIRRAEMNDLKDKTLSAEVDLLLERY
jgi:glutamine synthetase